MKAAKIVLVIIGSLVLLFIAGYAYLMLTFPRSGPPPALIVARDSVTVARGRYLANHVSVCIDCHSHRDWRYYSGPPTPGTEGQGGDRFGEEEGLPGTFYAKNITPYALALWTDGEIARAITSGVSRNGEPFFPLMPYLSYNQLVQKDLEGIIAYVRTLAPIKKEIPSARINFPVNLLMRTGPRPYHPPAEPSRSDTIKYGGYLTTISGCAECHTKRDRGKPIEGMDFGGGNVYQLPTGILVSANITPDQEMGIGLWNQEAFVDAFKFYEGNTALPPGDDGKNTIMPWTMYAGMTVGDLAAIFDYLRTMKPIRNPVVRFMSIKK